MSKASNKEFKLLFNFQIGFIQSSWYKKLYREASILTQLSEFGSTLGDEYLALKTLNQLTSADNQGSVFCSALFACAHCFASDQEWWDNQSCDVCGKTHPTKYHDTLSARDNKDLQTARTKACTITDASKPAGQQPPCCRFCFKMNNGK